MPGTSAEALLDEAVRRQRAGARAEAEKLYRRVLAARPEHARAHFLLGSLLAQAGAVDEATAHLARAAALEPGNAEAHARLGTALAHQGRSVEAAAALARALDLDPDHATARFNLGVVCTGAGALEEAEGHFRRVLARHPEHADAALNLSEVLRRRQRLEAALEVLTEAIGRAPDIAPLRVNQGNLLKYLGRLGEAEAAYRAALDLRPDDALAHANLLLCALYEPERSPAEIRDLHAAWGRRRMAALGGAPAPPRPDTADPDRPLRVGYLSPDLRDHPVAAFIGPVLAHHDPARVAVTCYANVANPDAVTERLRCAVPAWRDVDGLPDRALAAQIRTDGIDILVDLAGHTGNSRLAAMALAPAPVQATYLGYPATTGLPTVGYRLTDALADPPGTEGLYTERLVRLEPPFCCYEPPEAAPEVGPLPARANGHVTFGSQANPVKINARVLALWARVLTAVPGARLLLASGEYAAEAARDRILEGLAPGGVTADRVTFRFEPAPAKADFLARYQGMDISLDTFPYAGHTSTCEALWMGVPVLTLAGEWYIQRVGVSLLAAVGLPELAAGDADTLVATARELAADPGRLEGLRAGLRARMAASPLLDGAGFTRRLEAAFRGMWRDACAAATTPD